MYVGSIAIIYLFEYASWLLPKSSTVYLVPRDSIHVPLSYRIGLEARALRVSL